MGEGRPKGGHALAILPGLTHCDVLQLTRWWPASPSRSSTASTRLTRRAEPQARPDIAVRRTATSRGRIGNGGRPGARWTAGAFGG